MRPQARPAAGGVEFAEAAEFFNERRDYRLEELVHALAGILARAVSARVDNDDGRPRVGVVGIPDDEIRVVDDGMFDAEAADGLDDAFVLVLGGVLAGVDADDGDAVAKFCFKALEVRDDVLAVDAAGGPEIEEDDPPAEVFERERPGHIEPGEPGRERGSGIGAGPGAGFWRWGHDGVISGRRAG